MPPAPPTSVRLTAADGWSLHLACYPVRPVVGTGSSSGDSGPFGDSGHSTSSAGFGGRPPAAMLLSSGMMLDGRAMDRPPGRGLASFFQARGFAVYSLDLRGHGRSGPPASRRVDWSFDDLVTGDIPAAVGAVKLRHPDLPLIWLGHSLSAHAGAVAVGLRPELPVDLLVLLCPGPWVRAFEPSWPLWQAKRGVLRAWDGVAALCGSFPASRFGVGTDDESRGYVRQHREWAASGGWQSRDGAADYMAALARVRQPALVVAAGGDLLCRPASVRRFAAAIGTGQAGAAAEHWRVSGRDLGRRLPPGHMSVITAPPCLPVWERIDGWLRARL
jgi:predicted alpha/beta hydrolase